MKLRWEEGVMSHIWMRHVTRMRESRHTYEWVMSHIWMSHVTHMNEVCHTYAWGMSYIWMGHVPLMNEACHTCAWVMSYIWIGHVTHVNESCHTYELGMSHVCMSHIKRMEESWHMYKCVMSRIGWLRLVGSLKSQVSFVEYRLFYGAFWQKRPIILRSLLIVATPYECVACLNAVMVLAENNQATQIHQICMNEACHTYECVMSRILMSHVTYKNASCHIHEWVTSYLRMPWRQGPDCFQTRSHVTRTNDTVSYVRCFVRATWPPIWKQSGHSSQDTKYVWLRRVTQVLAKETHN